MTSYNTISDSRTDADSIIDESLITDLRNNPIAMFEGSVGAPRLQALAITGAVAGSNVIDSRGFSFASSVASYTKYMEWIVPRDGTFTTEIYMNLSSAFGDAYTQIYKNGSAFGTERHISATGSNTWSEDLAFSAGDLMQVFIKVTNNNNGSYHRVRLKVGNILPLAMPTGDYFWSGQS